MNWVNTLAVIFHVALALAIVGLVLLQRGKGADAGAGFGAGASGTVFGSRGSASFLSRTTAVLATLFFLTSLGLSYLFSQQKPQSSVMDALPAQEAPARTPTPATGADAQPQPAESTPANPAPATQRPAVEAVPGQPSTPPAPAGQ